MGLTDADRDELTAYVDGRIRKVREDLAGYGGKVDRMVADVANLVASSKARPGPIHWPAYYRDDPDEADAAWAAMVAWVGDVLPMFPRPRDELRPCWAEHPDALAYVTSAWTTWVAAYATPKAPARTGADWLAGLPLVTDQLREALGACRDECIIQRKRRAAAR